MNTYAIIERNSGYIWGVVKATDPIEACRTMDADIGGEPREYEEVYRETDLKENGYLVFKVANGWWCDNYQSEEHIADLVNNTDFAAYIRILPFAG
ncbi:MAG: hypothetical protein AAFR28_18515 [Pseudomonadota bacterium]